MTSRALLTSAHGHFQLSIKMRHSPVVGVDDELQGLAGEVGVVAVSAVIQPARAGSWLPDPGGYYFTRLNPEKARTKGIRQLEAMGYHVTVDQASWNWATHLESQLTGTFASD